MVTLTEKYLCGVPLVESPFFYEDAPKVLNELDYVVARDLHEKGYAIIDFPDERLFSKFEQIKKELNSRCDWKSWADGSVDHIRFQDAWQYNNNVKEIAANEKIIELLSKLYMRRPIPFQTLNFPVGTQQTLHSDHAHFNSVPDRFMCGVWVAMEDIHEDSGPLFFYPKSHHWPSFQNEHFGEAPDSLNGPYSNYKNYTELWSELAKSKQIVAERFIAKKGQALIWASNLVHGGSPQTDKSRTRWSQVTHYFFEGCSYTTPVANDVYQGQILFRQIVDIRNGELVKNVVNGRSIDQQNQSSNSNDYQQKIDGIRSKIQMSRFIKDANIPDDFNPLAYAIINSDLLDAAVDPYEHYILFGKAEGRLYK